MYLDSKKNLFSSFLFSKVKKSLKIDSEILMEIQCLPVQSNSLSTLDEMII